MACLLLEEIIGFSTYFITKMGGGKPNLNVTVNITGKIVKDF